MTSPPRIVTIGAGTGHAAILRGLQDLRVALTAIVGVTDNGGHTGLLREALGGPAIGDARHCLEALCPDERWRSILMTRGKQGPMRGASVGNLILSALVQQHGSLSRAIEILRRGLGIRAQLLPVSDGAAHVVAELVNDRRIRGEWQILQRHPRSPIRRVTQAPPLRLLAAVRRAIARADLIVLAPGALWTALGAVLSTRGLAGALRRAWAPKVWVANILSQPPQMDSDSIEDHVSALTAIIGTPPDFVLVNTRRPSPQLLRRYAATGAHWLMAPAPEDWVASPTRYIRGDFLERPSAARLRAYDRHAAPNMAAAPHWIRHDGRRVAEVLVKLAERKTRRRA